MKDSRTVIVFLAFMAGLMASGVYPALAQDKQTDNMQIVREKLDTLL
jgi:hypothetical protein